MTPTQAKIEAFEEAKRILEKNAREACEAGGLTERWAIEDIDREIIKLRREDRRQAPPSKPQDEYRDFSGFGT
jgi:hypothetical protein